jgi:hypothetical protein
MWPAWRSVAPGQFEFASIACQRRCAKSGDVIARAAAAGEPATALAWKQVRTELSITTNWQPLKTRASALITLGPLK